MNVVEKDEWGGHNNPIEDIKNARHLLLEESAPERRVLNSHIYDALIDLNQGLPFYRMDGCIVEFTEDI